MAENSYLREFIAQVSQIVFLADLTVLQVITTVWTKNFTKLKSLRVVCTNNTNRVLNWFDRFTAYYYCMSKKFKKTHISTSSVHNYQKECF